MNTKIMATCLSLTLLCSCGDFLDEKVYSFAEGNTLFANASNTEKALTGAYDALNANAIQNQAPHALFSRNIHLLTQLGCDEMIGRTDYIGIADIKPFCNYTYNSESRFLGDAWFALYAGIYRANGVIENAPKVADMTDERRKEVVLEARFLRGFYYTYLAWFWGGVPLQKSVNDSELTPRSSLKDVYELIINDLKSAYEGLPERNTYDSRANKYTAAAMLAKVYLYLAACKENNVGADLNFPLNSFDWVDSNAMYAEAKALCADIYENGAYILNPEYAYNFIADRPALKAEQAKEAVMVATFGKEAPKYFVFAHLTGTVGNITQDGGGAGWFPALGELISLYDKTDVRYKQNIGGANTKNKVNIMGVEYYVPSGLYQSGVNTFLTKFRQSSPAARLAVGIPAASSVLNFPILRFADVILMYAEATYKTGDEAEARKLLEPIRLRAAGNNAAAAQDLATAYHKDNFMDELKDERSRELCAEGWRRMDLIRWGRLQNVVQNLKTSNENGVKPNIFHYNTKHAQAVKDNFQSYKIWYPIPKRDREANPNLVQNPGWE